MSHFVNASLDHFFTRIQQHAEQTGRRLLTEFDEQWLSPCQQGEIDEQGMIEWKPVLQQPITDFSSMEQALELDIHPDLKAFYGRYYSENVQACTEHGNLELLQCWNSDDAVRLQQNLIGHVLMKRRLKQPVTFFIALTDEEDFILTLDNESGAVMLEQVGLQPQKQIAANLAEFIDMLQLQGDN